MVSWWYINAEYFGLVPNDPPVKDPNFGAGVDPVLMKQEVRKQMKHRDPGADFCVHSTVVLDNIDQVLNVGYHSDQLTSLNKMYRHWTGSQAG